MYPALVSLGKLDELRMFRHRSLLKNHQRADLDGF